MPILARVMFCVVNWAARKGLTDQTVPPGSEPAQESAKLRARQTGVRGETYAYWYLRRHGYVMVARNFTYRGTKGEIDLVGYDGATIAFVEVKTRTAVTGGVFGSPEEAVTHEKRQHLSRMARQFLREYRMDTTPFRFDVLAIEAAQGKRPIVRLHKGAFAA